MQLNKIEPSILAQIFEGMELHDLNQEFIYSCQVNVNWWQKDVFSILVS